MDLVVSRTRLCLGYAIAPLATPLFFLAFGWLSGGRKEVNRIAGFVFFTTPAAYLIAFIFGTALVIWLSKHQQTRWWMFALGGLFVGAIPALILPSLFFLCTVAGALSSWLFWVCVYWQAKE